MNKFIYKSPEVGTSFSNDAHKNAQQAPKEPSKLARLCQQTTSVLASILPAPFGGHERSILCQFFGNIQVDNGSIPQQNSSVGLFKRQKSAPGTQNGFINQPVANIGLDVASMSFENEPSVSILQQADRPPVTLLSSGKHPIQLVLEQQQRQFFNPNHNLQNHRQLSFTNQMSPIAINSQNDLKASASVISNVYHQRLIPPPSMSVGLSQKPMKQMQPSSNTKPKVTRFSEPLVTTSVTQSSKPPALSTRGWRGLNDSLTTIAPQITSRSKNTYIEDANFTGATLDSGNSNKKPEETNLKLSSDSYAKLNLTSVNSEPQRQTPLPLWSTTVAKRGKSHTPDYEFAATSIRPENRQNNDSLIRTIEVIAQANNEPEKPQEKANNGAEQSSNTLIALVNKTAISPEVSQVQKHEELVIASINNLTRIAFGNQLRDTVRVINKLIDQQSGLFAKSGSDPMVVSESKGSNVTVKSAAKSEHKAPIKDWNMREKLKVNKSAVSAKPTYSKPQKDTTTSALLYKYSTTPASKLYSKSNMPSQTRTLSTTESNTAAKLTKKLTKHLNTPREKYHSGSKRNSSGSSINSTTRAYDTRYRSQKQSRDKPSGISSITSRELKRITPQMHSDVTGRDASSSKLDYSIEIDSDFLPQMGELHRDKTPETGTSATRAQAGTQQSSRPYRTRNAFETSGLSRASTTPKRPTETIDTASSEFNWLLPDRSAYRTDLFETESINSERVTSEKRHLTTPADSKRYTTRRTVSTNAIDLTQSTSKPALILNRIEPTTKIDSLTTLKMSLARSTAANSDQVPSSTMTSTTTAGTMTSSSDWQPSTAPSTGERKTSETDSVSGMQSRWIPTVVMNRLPPPITTLSAPAKKIPLPVTTKSTTMAYSSTTPVPSTSLSTTTTSRPYSSTPEINATSSGESLATSASSQSSITKSDIVASQNNINEVRASDSISRYTTHWNEANEILATTRRYVSQPLPQIANTGEYFSAETISSWPEKYQAMMDRALEATTKSGFNSETTRRNGYSYDDNRSSTDSPMLKSRADHVTSARHRLGTGSTTDEMYKQTTTMAPPTMIVPIGGMFAAPLSGITVLPPNHKLTPTTGTITETTATELDKSTDVTVQFEEETDQTDETKQTTPYIASESTLTTVYQPSDASVTQPQALATTTQEIGSSSLTESPKVSNVSANVVLRAPYITEAQNANVDLSDPTLVLDSDQSRPHVSRKLYEMLVPSSRTFVGSQNPLNQPKFNLSALKFLAQNLFAPLNHQSANHTNETASANSDANAYRLLDAFGGSQTGNNSPEQIDLLLNDTAIPEMEDMPQNVRNSSAKNVFQRTGNLLNELKKLEQRRAAAILAAIRYQVPSPLVRPWDLATDLFPVSGNVWPSMESNITDRFDATGSANQESAEVLVRDKLASMSRAIKSALFKQRVIPRDELEARLNRGVNLQTGGDTVIANRRLDSDSKYTIDPKDIDGYPYEFYSEDQVKQGGFMDKILNLLSTSASGNKTFRAEKDFDIIDLKNSSKLGFINLNSDEHYPRYIRFADYQTAWTKGPEINGAQLYQEQLPAKQREPKSRNVESAIDKTSLDQNNRWLDSIDDTDRNNGQVNRSKQTKLSQMDKKQIPPHLDGFTCNDKPAGFYPDTDSACRVST